jgi:hypothetical protein
MGKIVNTNRIIIIALIIISGFLFSSTAFTASTASREDKMFENAYESYISYQPDKALELFNLFLREYPDSSAKDAAMFWKAKALIQLRRPDAARELFRKVQEQFPESYFRLFAEKEIKKLIVISYAQEEKKETMGEPDSRGYPSAAADRILDLEKADKEKMKIAAQKYGHLRDIEGTDDSKIDDRQKDTGDKNVPLGIDASITGLIEPPISLKRTELSVLADGDQPKERLEQLISPGTRDLTSGEKYIEADYPLLSARQQFNMRKEDSPEPLGIETFPMDPKKEQRIEPSGAQKISRPYDVRVMASDEMEISLYQISEEAYFSSRVLSKMNIDSVSWRSGNLYENLLIEQVLFDKAAKEGIQIDSTLIDAFAQRYSFNIFEKNYLIKYKTIEQFVETQTASPEINEQEMRSYYDKHRDEYIIDSREKTVQSLILNYAKGDRALKAKLAMKLYHEALNGRSFIDIYNANTGSVVFKQTSYTELPTWIREKTRQVPVSELHNLVSTLVIDDQYIIMKILLINPVYMRFEDARQDILETMKDSQKKKADVLKSFLYDIRKEAAALK